MAIRMGPCGEGECNRREGAIDRDRVNSCNARRRYKIRGERKLRNCVPNGSRACLLDRWCDESRDGHRS